MREKTGAKCSMSGKYRFDGYVNAPVGTAKPTAEETVIPMNSGDTFPPVRSTKQAAWWVLAG